MDSLDSYLFFVPEGLKQLAGQPPLRNKAVIPAFLLLKWVETGDFAALAKR